MATLADRYLPRRAVISADAAGDHDVVAPVAGRKLVVVSFMVVNVDGTTQQVTFKSWDGSTDNGDLDGLTAVTGALGLPEIAGGVLPFAEPMFGVFETPRGEGIAVELAENAEVGGMLTYVAVA